MSSFVDQTLSCKDCGQEFVWTADEQAFYESKGFKNAPVRCPKCREEKRNRMREFRRNRPRFEITCANCGKVDTVPFKPKGDRPVLCADCFKKEKEQGSATASHGDHSQQESVAEEHEIPMEEEIVQEENA